MENPFLPQNQNPFQTPYQAPVAAVAPGVNTINFSANDLPAQETSPANNTNPFFNTQASSSSSPFLDGSLSKTFSGRESTISPNTNQALLATPSSSTFATKPSPLLTPIASTADFSPVPIAALPIAARQSQIMAISEIPHRPKPDFFQTSTATVDGFSIQEYLGMLSVEVVIPKDLLFRNPAPHGELHRMKDAEEQLQRVKVAALQDLSAKAKGLGADGLVGVSLQFSQFDAIVCLCSAVGTAVKLGY